jgi:hypothetical protein
MADKVKPYKISPREFDRFDRIKTLYLGKSGYKKISKEVLKANFDWLNKFYNANIDSIINIDTIIPMRPSYYNTRELVIKCARKSRVNVEDFLNKHFGIDKLTKKIEEVTEREALKGNKKTYLYTQERQKIEKLKIIEVLKPEILQVLKKLNILKSTIFKCAKEIVNFIIDDCNGIYTDDKIRELVVSSFLVSLALITAHDLEMDNVQGLFINDCNISLIKKMQIDILERTDYQGCKKTIGLKLSPIPSPKQSPIPSPKQSPKSPKTSPKSPKQSPKSPKQSPKSPKQSPKSPKQSPKTSPKQSPKKPPTEWLLMFDKDQDAYFYNKWLNIKNTYPPLDTDMLLYKNLNIKIDQDYIMRILRTGEPYYKNIKNNTHSMQPPVDMKKLFPFGIELFLDSRNVPTYLVRKE